MNRYKKREEKKWAGLLTFVGAEVYPESFGHALQKEEWISGLLSLSKEEEEKLDSLLSDALAF